MYDVSYETKNFSQAIVVINKLITFDTKYKEDLTSLYMATNQFDKALNLINELNATSGKTERRELYKIQILSEGKYQNTEISNLITQISLLLPFTPRKSSDLSPDRLEIDSQANMKLPSCVVLKA